MIYFFLSFMFVHVEYQSLNETSVIIAHNTILSGEVGSPGQYRILSHLLVESFSRLSQNLISLRHLHKYLDILSLTLALIFLYLFANSFFSYEGSLIISLLFFSLFHFAFWVGGMFVDLLALAFFLSSLYFIIKKRFILLCIITLLFSFAKEIAIFVPFFYFLAEMSYYTLKDVSLRIILNKISRAILLLILSSFGRLIMVFFYGQKSYIGLTSNFMGQSNFFGYNASCESCLFYVILFFNVFIVLFFIDFKKKPRILKALSIGIIPFIISIYYFGLIREVRLFLPIMPVVLSLAGYTLFPSLVLKKN